MMKILSLQALPVNKPDDTQGLVDSTQSNHCDSGFSVHC